ncbi:MAG TPA: SDR family oxidoreductase [Ohtaekwangia sp.]|uniref:SDR family oxidoreductase n=1 Tax=Ohtaekwangia sp. TaxID=2066019 RepID=UPI002F95B022
MNKFKGKTVVITGGNSGIGYATAKEFKEQGATVIITGRRKEAIQEAAQSLGITGIVADQSKVTDTEALAAQVSKEFGKVDILFINAGVVTASTIELATEAQYDNMMDINLRGAFFTLSKFIPHLADGASVVFLSSNTASMTRAGSSIYSASKAALNSIMKTAAVELAPRNIRVNSVSPGPTETEIIDKMGFDEQTVKAIKEDLITKIPLHKIASAADIASMVAYICGDASSFITGSNIIMDGGMVLG